MKEKSAKPVSGIYIFMSPDHRPLYIGSSDDIASRIHQHLRELNNGYHHNSAMQADWPFPYYIELYQRCSGEQMSRKENELIHLLEPKYNSNKSQLQPPDIDKEHFWSTINVGKPDECWPAKRINKKHGTGEYDPWNKWSWSSCGTKKVKKQGKRKYHYSHRIAYWLHCGVWPAGAVVRHMCNNRSCCNPKHLKLGSVGDNNRDPGVKRGKPPIPLADNIVLSMIADYQAGLGIHKIGEKFSMNSGDIHKALTNKYGLYSHIIPKDFQLRRRRNMCRNYTFEEIKQALPATLSLQTVCSRIRRGQTLEQAISKPKGFRPSKDKIVPMRTCLICGSSKPKKEFGNKNSHCSACINRLIDEAKRPLLG